MHCDLVNYMQINATLMQSPNNSVTMPADNWISYKARQHKLSAYMSLHDCQFFIDLQAMFIVFVIPAKSVQQQS